MAEMIALKNHPLLLTLRDVISGDGFLAGITLSGRALVRLEEDGKWWMYGVRPAGIAESGISVEDTFLRFRKKYQETMFDIAQESRTYEEFKAEVERFFEEPDANPEDERLWEEALAGIRFDKLAPPAPFANLPRESPETRPSQIGVQRLDGEGKRFKPSDNVTDTYSLAQAA